MTENTIIIVEALLDTDFSYMEGTSLEIIREKKYKSNEHIFFRKKV